MGLELTERWTLLGRGYLARKIPPFNRYEVPARIGCWIPIHEAEKAGSGWRCAARGSTRVPHPKPKPPHGAKSCNHARGALERQCRTDYLNGMRTPLAREGRVLASGLARRFPPAARTSASLVGSCDGFLAIIRRRRPNRLSQSIARPGPLQQAGNPAAGSCRTKRWLW